MYIACFPPSPNVLGGESGAPGGNHRKQQDFLKYPFSLIQKMLDFKNSATVSHKWASAMGIKCFLPEKQTVVVVVVVIVASN